MTEISRGRTNYLTKWHDLLRTFPGIAQFSILILFGVFATGKGYEYNDYLSQPYNNYQPQPSSYSYGYSPPPQYEQYTAVTYQELNTSYHCGVIPDTNFELYRSNSYDVAEVAPFGKFPWIVLILSYNKVICQGTLVHYNLILTSSYCIPKYKSLESYEIRVGDWDLLTDYNEYEAYADRELRVCSRHPLSRYTPKSSYYGGNRGEYDYSYYKDDSSDLVIIKSDYEPSDKFPHVKPICLPKTYTTPKYYGEQNKYAPTAVCWVAGWYGSEITPLRNHPGPTKVMEYDGGYSPYKQQASYYQNYYKGYDNSMIQKRAKVKQVTCPAAYGYSYSYGYSSPSTICFEGVDGYDACVADQGAAVFCVIEEYQNYGAYDAGYNNKDTYYSAPKYEPVDASYEMPVMSTLHPEYSSPKTNYYSKPQIKAAPSPSKPSRYRAVLYAVVQKTPKCTPGYYGSSYNRKSRPLVATLVDYEAVSGIMDLFWTHGYDKSCLVPNAKYKAPMRAYYGPRKSYKNAYYFGSYYNAPRSSYGYYKNSMSYNNY